MEVLIAVYTVPLLKLVFICLHPYSELPVTPEDNTQAQTTSWRISSPTPQIYHHLHTIWPWFKFSTAGKICHTTVGFESEEGASSWRDTWRNVLLRTEIPCNRSLQPIGHILLFAKQEFVSSGNSCPSLNSLLRWEDKRQEGYGARSAYRWQHSPYCSE